MKKSILTIILLHGLMVITAQSGYSKKVTAQIKLVENSLWGNMIIDGKADNITDRMRYYNVKGLSIAVIEDYKIVWAKGYGWADEQQKYPVTTATLFKPGSISKSLNAIGALKLVQEGKLELYTDINRFLSSWQFPYDSMSKGKKITLAQLLSHTAGTSVYGGFPGYPKNAQIPTIPQVLDGVLPANTPAVRSLIAPGEQFQYSGGGTIISQLMMTDATGMNYEKLMYETVLKPLGMKSSFYSAVPPTGQQLKKIAQGYTVGGEKVKATYNVYPEQAPMGLWTTPKELGYYLIETQLSFEGKSSKVLNRDMTRLHLTPYIDHSSAMGTFVQERDSVKYFFHDAGNVGYRGLYFASVGGGSGVVVFVNSDDGNIIIELLNSVAWVYNWRGFTKPQQITTVNVPDSLAKKYVGLYLFDGMLAEVTKKKDELYYWADGIEAKMYFITKEKFINKEFPTEKTFLTDTAGNITGYSRKANGTEYPAATKIGNIDTIKTNKGEMNRFARYLLEAQRLDEAIIYINKGLALEPDNVDLTINLAHCFLFKKESSKAIDLYKVLIGSKIKEGRNFKAIIKTDFERFKQKGLSINIINKAKTTLEL
jgi:CubicO group peptidase (beta-lactamase class C family)